MYSSEPVYISMPDMWRIPGEYGFLISDAPGTAFLPLPPEGSIFWGVALFINERFPGKCSIHLRHPHQRGPWKSTHDLDFDSMLALVPAYIEEARKPL